jgi:oxygen-independent coproporphyrinogen-3 oxidase
VKDKSRTRFIYRDRLWAGADLVGLGVASFGHIGGTHYQNQHEFEPYVNALADGKLPVYRALTPSADERLIREFILQLKLGQISAEYFRHKFGIDVRDRFAEPLHRLQGWGFLEIVDDTVCLNREGLLQVDSLLSEFFLPQHQHARYA